MFRDTHATVAPCGSKCQRTFRTYATQRGEVGELTWDCGCFERDLQSGNEEVRTTLVCKRGPLE